MSIISDLHLGIYEYNDKKDKQMYLEKITDCIESAENPLLKTLLQKATDNQIEVCADSEPESKPEKLNCPEFNFVYTGCGVQIWISLFL